MTPPISTVEMPARFESFAPPAFSKRLPGFARLAGNILVASLYVMFLAGNLRFFLRTGSPVGLGLVGVNTLLAWYLLTRRPAGRVSGSIANWLIAPVTQVLPFLFRAVETASFPMIIGSLIGQLAAIALMLWSLVALNRSIGIVAANRGVRTAGPYGFIRHPLYAGEILFFVSFTLGNASVSNGVLALLVVVGQLIRSQQEEELLEQDPQYHVYRTRVRYRLIPRLL